MTQASSEFKEVKKLEGSPFQIACEEDCKIYSRMLDVYMGLQGDTVNAAQANNIANTALVLASRWSDICSYSKSISLRFGFGKSDFSMWAHERYSVLKDIHIHARMIWSKAEDEYRETMKYGGQT